MFPILLVLWIVFSGGVAVNTLVIGTVVCALVTVFANRYLGYSSRRFYGSLKKTGKFLGYLVYLMKEIILANLAVIKLVWRRRPVDPVIVRFNSDLKTEKARVLVANSITLTPGTYTVKLEGGHYEVHALDKSLSDGIESCDFFRRAAELEA